MRRQRMNKAYKYRIYPTVEQEKQLADTFGSCRFVYNHYLALQSGNHEQGKKHLGRTACNNDCNRNLKQEYPWLRQVDKFALTNAIYALEAAYQRFYRKQGGYPKFKGRRRSRMSYTTNFTNGNIAVLDGEVKLPKLGKVKAVIHRAMPEGWNLKQATVLKERDGSYYVSVLYEYQTEITPQEVRPERIIGLDYKSDGLYMDSSGVCCNMPHFFRKSQKKLAKAQRKLKQKQLHSANYRKQQKKIARTASKTADQRKDFLHKKSVEIANQYDLVCVEDLDMRYI
ncbi:helix-turn-helix domain-containing protein [Clostridium sp. MCC353]|nr:helix-turn-helix domain-containing protein [Clostridium sp. MCC353]